MANEELKKIVDSANGEEQKKDEGAKEADKIITPQTDKEKEELKLRVSELEFDNAFKDIAQTYPYASEFKDNIKEKVKSGYSIQDATFAVLGPAGKIVTREQMNANENKGSGFGGSAPTPPLDSKDKSEKTLDELRKDFQDMEARGEIRLS